MKRRIVDPEHVAEPEAPVLELPKHLQVIWDVVRIHEFRIDPIRIWHTIPIKQRIRAALSTQGEEREIEVNAQIESLCEAGKTKLIGKIKKHFSDQVSTSVINWIEQQSIQNLFVTTLDVQEGVDDRIPGLAALGIDLEMNMPVNLVIMQAVYLEQMELYIKEEKGKFGAVKIRNKQFSSMEAFYTEKKRLEVELAQLNDRKKRRQTVRKKGSKGDLDREIAKAEGQISALGADADWEEEFKKSESLQEKIRVFEVDLKRNLQVLESGVLTQILLDNPPKSEKDMLRFQQIFDNGVATAYALPVECFEGFTEEQALSQKMSAISVSIEKKIEQHRDLKQIFEMIEDLNVERGKRYDAMKFWLYIHIIKLASLLILTYSLPTDTEEDDNTGDDSSPASIESVEGVSQESSVLEE